MKVNESPKAALKIAHISLGCLWLSGLIAMLVCLLFPSETTVEEKLLLFHAIDEWIVIPCAVAAVITGLVLVRIMPEYSLNKGSWLFRKLIFCCLIMFGGYFFVKTPLLSMLINFLLAPFSMQIEDYTLFLALTIKAIIFILLVFHLSIVKVKHSVPKKSSDTSTVRTKEQP